MPASDSGIRLWDAGVPNEAALKIMTRNSRIGGTISPSSKTLVAALGMEPGTAPPMSSWCPKAWTNATTSRGTPSSRAAKTGTVTHRSGRWPIPPSER